MLFDYDLFFFLLSKHHLILKRWRNRNGSVDYFFFSRIWPANHIAPVFNCLVKVGDMCLRAAPFIRNSIWKISKELVICSVCCCSALTIQCEEIYCSFAHFYNEIFRRFLNKFINQIKSRNYVHFEQINYVTKETTHANVIHYWSI